MVRPYQIMLAVDFSRASVAALEATRDLARRLEADVTLFHAYHPTTRAPTIAATVDEEASLPFVEAESEMHLDAVLDLTRQWAEPLQRVGVTVDVATRAGRADSAIVAAIAERKPDLVILGRLGAGRVRRVLTGSVTRYVVEHAERPVLVVPIPE